MQTALLTKQDIALLEVWRSILLMFPSSKARVRISSSDAVA